MTVNWNPDVPHCLEEARIQDAQGNDGGGHWQCLTELNPDGTCPNEANHHDVFIASLHTRPDLKGWDRIESPQPPFKV